MTHPDDPAFPQWMQDSRGSHYMSKGLTVREEFAKAAMQGYLANPNSSPNEEIIASWSVHQADALIDELNKTNNEKGA